MDNLNSKTLAFSLLIGGSTPQECCGVLSASLCAFQKKAGICTRVIEKSQRGKRN